MRFITLTATLNLLVVPTLACLKLETLWDDNNWGVNFTDNRNSPCVGSGVEIFNSSSQFPAQGTNYSLQTCQPGYSVVVWIKLAQDLADTVESKLMSYLTPYKA